MSEEEALLAAIAASPDEDTPRLAYADWLDEHGRHARAEFLRVQIEVARVETLPRVLVNRYVDVFQRQQQLIDNHRDDLLGPLTWLPQNAAVEFRRGFVSGLSFAAPLFLYHADKLARLQPLPDIHLVDVAAHLSDLSAVEDRMRQLVATVEMQSWHRAYPVHLSAEQVCAAFAVGRPWARLRELNLEGCRMEDAGLRVLATDGRLPALADLDVSGNYLTDAGVVALLDSPLPRQLRRLILGGNPLTDGAAIELADRWPRGADDRLEYLNLRFTEISQPGQQALLARFGGRIDLF